MTITVTIKNKGAKGGDSALIVPYNKDDRQKLPQGDGHVLQPGEEIDFIIHKDSGLDVQDIGAFDPKAQEPAPAAPPSKKKKVK